jgi:hypothetical protein
MIKTENNSDTEHFIQEITTHYNNKNTTNNNNNSTSSMKKFNLNFFLFLIRAEMCRL